jgi:Rap1a immunity proteins
MHAIAVLVITLILSLPSGGAKSQTLGSMTHDCEKLEIVWRASPPTHGERGAFVPNDADAATCFGYMLAFAGLRQLIASPTVGAADCSKGVGPQCRPALFYCPPEGVLFDQVLAVFLTYARNHPAQWHEAAWSHYLNAMVAAFPCKGIFSETPSK